MSSDTDRVPRPDVRIEARAGTAVALRLRLHNRMMAATLVRPAVDDWVAHDGQILPSGARIEPSYVYLLQGAEARQTLSLLVPAHLAPDTVLTASLRFPGLGPEAVAIELRVLAPATDGQPVAPVAHEVEVALPLGEAPGRGNDDFGAMAQASYSLVAGLAGLDMLPARWLVAELAVALAQLGETRAETDEGRALLERLGRTRFFKNGVVAFASAQAPRWILSGLAATSGLHAALGGQGGQGQMLSIWERWLVGLADGDIESDGASARVVLPEATLHAFAATLGTQADRWFANIVLGLGAVSPRIDTVLRTIADQAPEPPEPAPTPAPPPDDVLGEGGSVAR